MTLLRSYGDWMASLVGRPGVERADLACGCGVFVILADEKTAKRLTEAIAQLIDAAGEAEH